MALWQHLCPYFRATRSWLWGTCWKSSHDADGRRPAPWRWKLRISWMMARLSNYGFRSTKKRWAGKEGEKLQTHNEEKLVLCLEWMCNQIQNPPSPQGSAVFDFSGTGTEVWGNCNAPRAITLSALIYCLRCMVRQDIPLNQVVYKEG